MQEKIKNFEEFKIYTPTKSQRGELKRKMYDSEAEETGSKNGRKVTVLPKIHMHQF